MPEPLSLETLERWMQTVLVHPESAEAGVVSEEAAKLVDPARVAEVVLPTANLSSVDRLGIYQEMYLLRMKEALESDYPALAKHLGAHRFWHFVEEYVEVYPSRSYTLNRLGDHVPEFASGWGPARERGRLSDLARLELSLTRVFDAGQEDPLPPDSLSTIPPEDWVDLTLRPVPAFALVKVRASALRLYENLLEEETPMVARAAGTAYVMFLRRGLDVRRRTLARGAGILLSGLVQGDSLGESLDRMARRVSTVPPEAIQRWCREWVEEGVFAEAAVERL